MLPLESLASNLAHLGKWQRWHQGHSLFYVLSDHGLGEMEEEEAWFIWRQNSQRRYRYRLKQWVHKQSTRTRDWWGIERRSRSLREEWVQERLGTVRGSREERRHALSVGKLRREEQWRGDWTWLGIKTETENLWGRFPHCLEISAGKSHRQNISVFLLKIRSYTCKMWKTLFVLLSHIIQMKYLYNHNLFSM